MKNTIKRIVSLLSVVAMAFTILPAELLSINGLFASAANEYTIWQGTAKPNGWHSVELTGNVTLPSDAEEGGVLTIEATGPSKVQIGAIPRSSIWTQLDSGDGEDAFAIQNGKVEVILSEKNANYLKNAIILHVNGDGITVTKLTYRSPQQTNEPLDDNNEMPSGDVKLCDMTPSEIDSYTCWKEPDGGLRAVDGKEYYDNVIITDGSSHYPNESFVTFNLNQNYRFFSGKILTGDSIANSNDHTGDYINDNLEIYGDGKKLYGCYNITRNNSGFDFRVNVSGVKKLKIIVYNNGSYSFGFFFIANGVFSSNSVFNHNTKESFTGTATNITNDQGIVFDKNVSFTMPDNIPGIGGEEFKLNLNSLGISYYQDNSSFKVGIGVKEDLLKDKDEMSAFKRFIDSNKKDYAKSMSKYIQAQTSGKIVSLGAKFKPEASVYGYLEGAIDNNGNRHVGTGKIVAKFKAKVSNEWQVVVVDIPIVLSASLEASVQGAVNATMPENTKIDVDGELKITIPKVEIGAGVGLVKVANVQAYGSIQNDMTIVKGGVKDTITGEAGVKVKFFAFEYKQVLWEPSKDRVVYDSTKKSLKSALKANKSFSASALQSGNYELAEPTRSLQMNKSDNSDSNIKTLLSGCNDNASPKIVKFNNNKALMVYTDSVSSRTKANQSAVMYKTYDGSTWSDATILSDDGTADYYPQVSSDGTTAYITWINANRAFNDSVTLDDFSTACDISVIAFDSSNMAVSGSAVALSDDNTLDMLPVVTSGSTPTVAWVKNSNSDILTNSGTNTIYYSTFNGDSWTNAVEYTSYANPVLDLSVGMINNNVSFAYLVDEDADITTTNDVEVYAGDVDSQPTRLTNNDIAEQSVKYRTINGTDSFVWCADNNLEYTNDLSSATAMYNVSSITSDYDIVNIDGNDKVVFSKTEDNKANIYASQIEGGFFVNEPVKITETSGYSRNVTATEFNKNLLLAFTRTNAEVSSDDIDTSTDLCVYESENYHKLQVTKIEYNDSDVAPGKTLQVTARVENNGMIEESNSVVSIRLGGQTFTGTINDRLSPGDSYDLPIDITMPSTNGQNELIATATPATGSNIENVEFKETIGGIDLQLTATTTDDKVVVNVNNISGYDSDAKLVIKKENESGTQIKEISLGNINSNQTITTEIPNSDLTSGMIYINAVATNAEKYTLDNKAFVYINQETPTAELKYQLKINDDGSTSVRFILVADEADVLAADSASVYVTIQDVGDTGSVKINRAYRSIKAAGETVYAGDGKAFLICKFIGIPDDMIDGMTAHFTLGENTYERTINS